MATGTIFTLVLAAASGVGGFLTSLFGRFDTGLQVLLILIGLDYLTGLICALVFKTSSKSGDGSFRSSISLKGLLRKCGIFIALIVACQLDKLMGNGSAVENSVVVFFTVNEGLSIIENLGCMGVPLPPVITKAFEALHGAQNTDSASTASDSTEDKNNAGGGSKG